MKTKTYFKEYLRFLFILIISFGWTFNRLHAQQTLIDVNGWNAYVHVPWDYSENSSKTYPTIIFFPGIGEVGSKASLIIANGPGAYIQQGWNGNVKVGSDSIKFIVISLQPPKKWPQETSMDNCIQTLKSMYRIDNDRLHLTGLSMGGWASTTYVTGGYHSGIASVVEVAGVVPSDNAPYPNSFYDFAMNGGRLLGFEQIKDGRDVKRRVDYMNAVKASSAIFVPTNFSGGGHCCWEQFYGGKGAEPGTFMLDGISQNIYEWMAANPLPTSEVTNQPPVSNAGPDVVIILPTDSAMLIGSGTAADGIINSYEWSQISGPGISTIHNAWSAESTVSNLTEGTYVFQLEVTDNNNAHAKNKMQLTVKLPEGQETGSVKCIMVNLNDNANPYNNSKWNNWNVGTGRGSNISSDLFKYSDGISSGISSVLSSSPAIRDNSSAYKGGMAPAEVLRYTSYSEKARTITLSGLLTTKKYDIELYASRWIHNNSTVFTINGNAVTIATYRNFTNKANFTNITPNALGEIVVKIQSKNKYNYLNGFMITEHKKEGFRPEITTQSDSTLSIAVNKRYKNLKTDAAKNPPDNNNFYIDHLRFFNNHLTFNVRSNKQQNINLTIADVKGSVFLTAKFRLQKGLITITRYIPGLNKGVFYVKLFTHTNAIVKPVLN